MASNGATPKSVKTPAKPAAKAVAKPAAVKAEAAPKPVAAKAKAPVAKPVPPVAKSEPVPPVLAPVVETVAAPIETPAAPAVIETVVEKTVETPTVAAKPAPVLKKELTMEDTIKTVTEKTQAAFADFNSRAKTAVEKSTKLFEDANEFGKGNVEALVESSKIAAKGFETMGQDAAAYAKKSFETTTATLKSLASVKSPADFFKLHSEYVRGAFDAAVAESAKSTEAMLKLAGEVAQPISNRFALAAEKVKAAA